MRRYIVFIFSFLTLMTFALIYYQQAQFNPITSHYRYNINLFPTEIIRESNIPEIYFRKNNGTNFDFSKDTCLEFPKLLDLQFVNDVWQYQEFSEGRSLYLFSAHLDEREWLGEEAVIRILGMYSIYRDNGTRLYCQVWLDGEESPIVVETKKFLWIWLHGWGGDSIHFHHPYVIPCPIPRNITPISVSLVENPCDKATNNLKVVVKRPLKKKNFAVCVKGLNFPYEDHSAKLVEWIETLLVMGAETIHFYEFSVHPNVKKVLSYYENIGVVRVDKLTLIGRYSNRPYLQNKFLKELNMERRLQEVIPYNDCFYEHFNDYKFVVLLDADEIIVPRESIWEPLIESLLKQYPDKDCYIAQNVYFFNGNSENSDFDNYIPSYMHMLRHVHRAYTFTKPGFYVKGFHNTDRVIALHNHFPLHCNSDFCRSQSIDVKLAQLNHYRADCVRTIDNCNYYKGKSVVDTRLWDFKTELIDRVTRTLNNIGVLEEKRSRRLG